LDDVPAFRINEGWIKVNALSRQNLPLIKSGRAAAQMPFANHAGVITGGLQILRHRRLRAIEAVKGRHAVEVTVFAGENGGAARRADGIDTIDMIETHSLMCQPV